MRELFGGFILSMLASLIVDWLNKRKQHKDAQSGYTPLKPDVRLDPKTSRIPESYQEPASRRRGFGFGMGMKHRGDKYPGPG